MGAAAKSRLPFLDVKVGIGPMPEPRKLCLEHRAGLLRESAGSKTVLSLPKMAARPVAKVSSGRIQLIVRILDILKPRH